MGRRQTGGGARTRVVVLATMLLLSLAAHVVRSLPDAGAQVVGLTPTREGRRLLVDFDRVMVPPERVGRDLEPGLVVLEPSAPVRARFLTPHRLELDIGEEAPRFLAFVARLSDAFTDAEGHPLASEGVPTLELSTGRLGLLKDPVPQTATDGAALIDLAFNGPVRAADLEPHVRVTVHDGPPPDLTLSGEGAAWQVRLVPRPSGSATLTLTAGLVSPLGPRGLAEDLSFDLLWPDALRVVDVDARVDPPVGRITLDFSHALAEQAIADYVQVSPDPQDLVVEADGHRLWIEGRFTPRARVTVRVQPGLRTEGGLVLAREAVRTLDLPAARPRLAIVETGTILAAGARSELEIEGVNVSAVALEVREVPLRNLLPLALGWARPGEVAPPGRVQRWTTTAGPDERFRRRVDLADLLGHAPGGALEVRVSDAEDGWPRASRVLQVTDLAPLVRTSADGTVVLVRRLSDGSAVAGGAVRVFDEHNVELAEGTTDPQGLLVLHGLAAPPRVITVERDGDLVYLDLEHHGLAHEGRDVAGPAFAHSLEAFVCSDRGVVRPGETVHLSAVVRAPGGGAPPEGLPLLLEITNPQGVVRRGIERRIDAFGLVAADVPIAFDEPTGTWRVAVRTPASDEAIGGLAFRVDAVVPDRIEVELELPEGERLAGEKVEVGVRARLLTGDAAPGLRARARVRCTPKTAPREDDADVVYGLVERAPAPFTVEGPDGLLDAEGRWTVDFELPDAGEAGLALEAVFEVEVIDVSGRAAFARETRTVVPRTARLGIGTPTHDGRTIRIVQRAAPEGETGVVEGTAVLERLEWSGGWVIEPAGPVWRGRTLALPVERVGFRIEKESTSVTFAEAGDGWFRIRVEAPDVVGASRELSRWGGQVRQGAATTGAPRLALTPLDRAVEPGSRARLALEAPQGGTLLLTVEGPGVMEAQVLDVEAGRREVQVVLPEAPAPGLYATATLLAAPGPQRPTSTRLLGACWIPFDRPARRLDVTLEVPSQALPEAELDVRVQTGAPAHVRVLAVDEGILRLTGHPVPDPLAHFQAKRRLATRLGDVWTRLVDRARLGSEDAEAGGGALAVRLDPTAKKTVEVVALASPLVSCDGEVHVRLPLPSWEGRLRLVVVAAGRDGVGASSASVIVEAPISVALHVPRALAPLDVCEIGVTVRGEDVTYDTELEGLEALGPPTDGRLRVRPTIRVGTAVVRLRAADRAGHVVVREARLTVRPATSYAVRRRVVSLGAGETLETDAFEGLLPAGRHARVVVGGLASATALPALGCLLEYPHGCLEQTISRAFPVLAWSSLWTQRLVEQGRVADIVDHAVDRVLSMQTADGGLALWPGELDPYPFGSAYAADFLLSVREFGRDVPQAPLERLLDWLERRLRRGEAGAHEAWVLARAGRGVDSYLDHLSEAPEGVEARAWLAAAYLHRGRGDRAEVLLAELGDPWSVKRETAGRLQSPVRAASTVLRALVARDPQDGRVVELARRLQHAAEAAERHTTQENAAALLALAALDRARARESVWPRGVVTLDGIEHPYDGEVAFALGAEAPGRVTIHADAPTHVVFEIGGFAEEASRDAESRGMSITRTIEGIQDGRLRQGEVYRVVLEGHLDDAAENVLLTDLLPGGLELEAARGQTGTFEPDRVETRDDRVLFFRTAGTRGDFRQTYLVRAVTPGRYLLPAPVAELLYAPEVRARGEGGATLEVVR